MQTELILQLDEQLVQNVQHYALRQGKTISQVVADCLATLTENDELNAEEKYDIQCFDERINEPDRPLSEYLAEHAQQTKAKA